MFNQIEGRREFLKLVSLLSLSGLTSHLLSLKSQTRLDENRQNVIIFVFDSLSAFHLNLYGYSRETMPNLTRHAEHATVYHSHYSAANWTMPGTASILTGTYPWTHRGFHFRGSVLDQFSHRNLFHILREQGFTCFGFSQNLHANMLLSQFRQASDTLVMPRDVPLADRNLSDLLFRRDYGAAIRSERAYLKLHGDELPNSLFLDSLAWLLRTNKAQDLNQDLEDLFPRGVPESDDIICTLEDTFDWLVRQLTELPQPYFAYIHLMPPHFPYRTRHEFIDIFNDGWRPLVKTEHTFTNIEYPDYPTFGEMMDESRRFYDEYVAYADAEFGRFFDQLSQAGALEDTRLLFTSDHGEMFERGIWAHNTETLFQPVIRVPLLIFEPGRVDRRDVYSATSSVDLLPTIMDWCGLERPSWSEGETLPPYSGGVTEYRNIFAVEAKRNPRSSPLNVATVAMIKEDYKLIKYWGYPDTEDFFEVYDLKNDPEELNDLGTSQTAHASELLEALRLKLESIDTKR